MSLQRLLVASILMISPLAFAADPPAQKPADNDQVKKEAPPQAQPQQQAQQRPQAQAQPQQQRPQQPGRFGFGQGFRFQRDAFADALIALGDLALTPNFMITNEQKESIQSLRFDHKLATDKWRGENADELQKLSDEGQAARESGDREKSNEIFQKRRSLMQRGPKPEDAVKKLMGLLNEEQRTRLEERMAQRRAEEEQQR